MAKTSDPGKHKADVLRWYECPVNPTSLRLFSVNKVDATCICIITELDGVRLDTELQRKALVNTREVKHENLRMTGTSEVVDIVSQANRLLVQNF